MNESEARRERERMERQARAPPGSPEAPAGSDRATGIDDPTPRAEYRDDPPEHDPSLWATHSLTCMVCETEFPAAPAGERRERLNDGKVDVGTCPECDRDVPVVESSVTLPSPQSGYDDTIHVVVERTDDDYGDVHSRAIAAYRDEDEAREVADERREPFVYTGVECVGLSY